MPAETAKPADPAQPAPQSDSRERAEELFAEGRALIGEGKLALACIKLDLSYRLDNRGDTLLNLAECHRRSGKTATAWREFDEAIRFARAVEFNEAMRAAKQLRDDLAKIVSELTVTVPAEFADETRLAVRLDGVPLARGQWGKPLKIDPGKHSIEADLRGYEPFDAAADIGNEADRKEVVVTLVRPPPVATVIAPPPVRPRSSEAADAADDDRPMAPAGLFDYGVRLDGMLAVPFAAPQTDFFSAGGGAWVKGSIGVRWADAHVGAGIIALAPRHHGDPPGTAITAGGGIRVKLPRDRFRVSPWIDGDALYTRTGPANRFGVAAAVGVSLPAVNTGLWVSPVLRYYHIFELQKASPTDADAKMVLAGAELEWGGPVRPRLPAVRAVRGAR